VSLSWKLTGFFAAFGLILGYFSFIAFGGVSTRFLLRAAAGMAGSAFAAEYPVRDAVLADSLDGAPNFVVADLLRSLPFVSNLEMLSDFKLYACPPGGSWTAFVSENDGYLRASPVRERFSEFLDRSVEGKAALSPHLFRVKRQSIPAFLSLPPGADGTRWVLGAYVDTSGILDFLADHGSETVLFLIGLCALAFLLGRFFAERFIRPLKTLVAVAEEHRAGNAGRSFLTARRDEIGTLSRTLEGMAGEIGRRRAETEERLRAMEAMNRIDKAVLSTVTRSELLERVAGIVNGYLDADSVAVALRDSVRAGWVLAALSGERAAAGRDGNAKILPLVADEFIDSETTLRITGYFEESIAASPPGFGFFAYDVMGASGGRIVSVPLYVDGKFLGALAVVLRTDVPLSPDARRTISMLADQTAVAVRSILEREEKEENFLGILTALTRSIDAKSAWTAGHSERVAEKALSLGRQLQMSERELGELRIAAILHDAGKLGVRESVLDKPGKLDPGEYDEIKRHPVLGGRILEGIRSFEGVVPAIVHHHERWDGGGYPDGLSGEAIPLAARIITVADVWDAITDDRPYRAGFPRAEAIRFMEEQSGRMFDPRLVRLFLSTKG